MEAVEEIPGIALAEGLKWNWESFPEYLDALDAMPRTIDIATQIPHHPLRVYVMGQRAIDLEAATAEDIATMRRLTAEGMRAGAFGFTTSRTNSHKTLTGGMVPSRYSRDRRAARHRPRARRCRLRRLRHEQRLRHRGDASSAG